jgi:hypothetical protein
MADETLRITLDTKGQDKVDAATASVDKLKASVSTVATTTTVATTATAANTQATTANTATTQTNTQATTTNTAAKQAAAAASSTSTTATAGSTAATAAATAATTTNTAATTAGATATAGAAAATSTASTVMGGAASAIAGMASGFVIVTAASAAYSLATAAVSAATEYLGTKLSELANRNHIPTQTEYMKKLGEATELTAEKTKALAELTATVEGGKEIGKQATPLAADDKKVSDTVKKTTEAAGGNYLAEQISSARRAKGGDAFLKSQFSTEKDYNGLSDQDLFQRAMEHTKANPSDPGASKEYNDLVEKAMAKAFTMAAQDVEQMQQGSMGERSAKTAQVVGDLEKTNPKLADEIKRANDPRTLKEKREAEGLAAQIKFNEERGSTLTEKTMTRPGDKNQENEARKLLEANNIPAATINFLLRKQNTLLAERQTLLEEQLKAQGYSADQIADEVEKAQRTKAESEALKAIGSVFTRADDANQANLATDLLRSQGFDQEAINLAIVQQNKTLKERQDLLRAQLRAQGMSGVQLDEALKKAQQTPEERANQERNAQGQAVEKDWLAKQEQEAKKVAASRQKADGSFTEGTMQAVMAEVNGDATRAMSVLDELSNKQRERIDLLKEELKAQGFSNAEIEKEVELKTGPKKELEREQRLLSQTGFNTEGVGNDILALTRSREQGGMGLSLDKAQEFEKQQLTDAMVMQGFSKTDAGKMADSLVRDSEKGVKDAMEDLARTMPDSIQGMKDLMREQMAAAERLERNGIKMVLGRR